jgi:hypothetical protein
MKHMRACGRLVKRYQQGIRSIHPVSRGRGSNCSRKGDETEISPRLHLVLTSTSLSIAGGFCDVDLANHCRNLVCRINDKPT